MMISIKDFFIAGEKLARIFAYCLKEIEPGKKLIEIERLASQLIKQEGAEASFKTVPGYHWAICINLNAGVVHGIPDRKVIRKGDLISLDMGLFYRGWHADMAYTIRVSDKKDEKIEEFLTTGKRALAEAIKAAKAGCRVGHISAAIQQVVEGRGYHCIRELTGHGIGQKLHQDPWIPCFLTNSIDQTPELKEGMGLAIEVIYTFGSPQLKKLADGWTIETQDGKISALFEKTVLVTRKGTQIITPFLWEK